MKKLLEVRKALKSKKPTFIRHDAHKKSRVAPIWRRPKGRQNKMRLSRKGYAKKRSTGYGSPTAVRGLSSEGLQKVVIRSIDGLNNLDPKISGIVISKTVGSRNKVKIIDHAKQKGFTILELNEKLFQRKLAEKLAAKTTKQKELQKKKLEKEKQAKKKTAKKKEETEELSEEDKKEQEKKEQDKVLTKKDQGVQ